MGEGLLTEPIRLGRGTFGEYKFWPFYSEGVLCSSTHFSPESSATLNLMGQRSNS